MRSALTGESIPVEKGPGDTVIGASINQTGSLRMPGHRRWAKTPRLAQIIRLVEEAAASKAPIAKLADKVSGVFRAGGHRHRRGRRGGLAAVGADR